jgi:hypothetical protein
MSVSFGGQQCLEQLSVFEYCAQNDLPTDWISKCHMMRIPRGMYPGEGHVLMSLGSIQSLDINVGQPLVFKNLDSPTKQSATLVNIFVESWTAITPGYPDDPFQACLVKLTDSRKLAMSRPINVSYNVLQTPGLEGFSYYTNTINGATNLPWTWEQMVQSIWNIISGGSLNLIGGFPGLPFTPEGTPEGFSFWGQSGWLALGAVLDRLECTLILDPLTNALAIERVGEYDSGLSQAVAKWETIGGQNYLDWDDYPEQGVATRIPSFVRTHFPIHPAAPGSSPWYYLDYSIETGELIDPLGVVWATFDLEDVDESLLSAKGWADGTYGYLYDDEAALYDGSGNLLNLDLSGGAPDLLTRARERVNDYYRVIYQGIDFFHQRYGDSIPDFLPGSQVREVVWYDLGDGYRTEIIRGPKKEPIPQLDPTFLKGQTLLNTQIQSNYSNLQVQDTRNPCRLVLAITATSTTISVDGTAMFPNNTDAAYVIQIDQEQIQVTTFTALDIQPGIFTVIQRGYNNTVPQAHVNNSFVYQIPTQFTSTDLQAPMTATATSLVLTAFVAGNSFLPNWPSFGRFVIGVITGGVTEFMLVTDGVPWPSFLSAPATVTLTVQRALLGSVAAAHNTGDTVYLVLPGDVPTTQRLLFDGEAFIQDGVDNQGRRVAVHWEVEQEVELIGPSTDPNFVGGWNVWLLRYNGNLHQLERHRKVILYDPATIPIV